MIVIMHRVASSNLYALGRDKATGETFVMFHSSAESSVYRYQGVDAEVFSTVLHSHEVGRLFHRLIKLTTQPADKLVIRRDAVVADNPISFYLERYADGDGLLVFRARNSLEGDQARAAAAAADCTTPEAAACAELMAPMVSDEPREIVTIETAEEVIDGNRLLSDRVRVPPNPEPEPEQVEIDETKPLEGDRSGEE